MITVFHVSGYDYGVDTFQAMTKELLSVRLTTVCFDCGAGRKIRLEIRLEMCHAV